MRDAAMAYGVCRYQLRKTVSSYRFALMLLLQLLFAIVFATPVSDFAAQHSLSVNALGLLPALTGDTFAQMLLMMGLVLLLSDAPFIDHNQMYLLLRCERSKWALGQIAFMAAASLGYLVCAQIVCLIVMTPTISLSADWGKLWTSVAYQHTVQDITMGARIVSRYSPLMAFGLSMWLSWLACCIMGFTMFLINLATGTRIGLIAGGLMCLINTAIGNSLFDTKLYSFSPVSLASLSIVDSTGMARWHPQLSYALWVMPAACAVLAALIVVAVNRSRRCLEMKI